MDQDPLSSLELEAWGFNHRLNFIFQPQVEFSCSQIAGAL